MRPGAGAVAAFGSVLAVLLLVGSAVGGPIPLRSTGPPFTGSSATIAFHSGPSAPTKCGHSGFTVNPTWNSTGGAIIWSGGTAVRASNTCSAPVLCGKNSTCSYVDIQLTLPIPSPSGASRHNLTAAWYLQLNDSWKTLIHAPCPTVRITNGSGYQRCSDSVSVYLLETFVYLVDLTNGSRVGLLGSGAGGSIMYNNGSSYFQDQTCVSSSCTTRNFTSGTLVGADRISTNIKDRWNSVFMDSTHAYELFYQFDGGVTTNVDVSGSPWSANTWGWLDLSSLGNGIFLKNIILA